MLKCGLLKPVICNLGKNFRPFLTQNAFFNYGNLNMPDKLYKTIEMEMRSSEPRVLMSYETFIVEAAKHLDITVGRIWWKKPTKKRWTLLKSVFVYRKHMVQYEVRTHYRWIQLHQLTGSTADTFLEYVERMLPEGVALKVTKLSLEPLPSHLEKDNIRKSLMEADLPTTEETENEHEITTQTMRDSNEKLENSQKSS